jgi:hypothetical protein
MLLNEPRLRLGLAVFAPAALLLATSCTEGRHDIGQHQLKPAPPRQVVVVAPVLNLSGTTEFDQLIVTDAVASELVGFPGISAVPVNSTMGALALRGKARVETPADAIELARQFNAQATLVTAVTEYRPYDPPVIGLIMQLYVVPASPTSANGAVTNAGDRSICSGTPELSDINESGPRVQLQRVFDAANEEVLEEVKSFADDRDGHSSPYGWHRYTKSQELYVRYCCWSLIRSILAVDQPEWAITAVSEARP